MRPIKCNKCVKVFRGGGTTRVMRKIVFCFCGPCWKDRVSCEGFMNEMTAPAKEPEKAGER